MSANALFYLSNPPFDVLTDAEKSTLASHSHIIYLDKGERLTAPHPSQAMIVIKGKLTQWQNDELIGGLHAGDWCLGADKDATMIGIHASEQSLIFVIDGKAIETLTHSNFLLKNQLFADLSTKTAQAHNRTQTTENAQMLHLPIRELGTHIKTSGQLPATATLFDSAVLMEQLGAKHALVNDGGRIGIITQTDLCRAIAKSVPMSEPIAKFANFNLFTINENHELSEALMIMLDNKVHRLPIVNDLGEIVGVLGQTELLNFLANHSALISWRIDNATTLDELQATLPLIDKFIKSQQQNGIKIHIIARTVQSLNAHIFKKVWTLIAPQTVIDNTCLIVMGSEGRGEQILRTDQDNALIIKDNFVDDDLPTYAKQFIDTLVKFGYPPCNGNIMLTNPIWQLHLTDFKNQLNNWLNLPTGEHLIHFATLLDAHYIVGDMALLHELQAHWQQAIAHSASNFLNRFAVPTIQMGDRATFWQKFTGGTDSDIDLKKAGIFPIVHGVRCLALEYGITATNTRTRINQLKNKEIFDEKFAQNLTEALEFFMAKRLAVSLDDNVPKRVNPNQLSALERDLLKESLVVAKSFKLWITRHYRLDIFGN